MNRGPRGYVSPRGPPDERAVVRVPGGHQAARSRALVGSVAARARPLAGLALLALLVWRLGSEPFLAGLRGLDGLSVVAALVLGAMVTACSAWRWTVVARSMGAPLPLRAAVAACYRSQFVNVATPGGVVGDVLRGVRQGRATGDTVRGLRSVVWERLVGQSVQVVLALLVLVLLPSPLPRPLVATALGAVVVTALVALVLRDRLGREPAGLLTGAVLRRAGAASALAVAGHVLTFLVAARSAGVTASAARLLPLSLVVLVAAAVPANLAGWGPREGVAAWVFASAGLGAGTGLSTAVAFGMLVLVANLPGSLFLAGTALRGPTERTVSRRPTERPVTARQLSLAPAQPTTELGGCRG